MGAEAALVIRGPATSPKCSREGRGWSLGGRLVGQGPDFWISLRFLGVTDDMALRGVEDFLAP